MEHTPGQNKISKKKVHKEIIEAAHRHGCMGETIYIPMNWMATVRLRLIRWMLITLEQRYEQIGDVPSNWAEVISLFGKRRISGFPEASQVDSKTLKSAREQAWNYFREWWYGVDTTEGEKNRVALVIKYGKGSGLDEDILTLYRDIRMQIRLGRFDREKIDLPIEDIQFLHVTAKRSLESGWRVM